MILQVVSVFDLAAVAYGRPVFVPALGLALRSFQDECGRIAPDNNMNAHPGDFQLFHMGSFDDSLGVFTLFPKPVRLALASDFVSKV